MSTSWVPDDSSDQYGKVNPEDVEFTAADFEIEIETFGYAVQSACRKHNNSRNYSELIDEVWIAYKRHVVFDIEQIEKEKYTDKPYRETKSFLMYVQIYLPSECYYCIRRFYHRNLKDAVFILNLLLAHIRAEREQFETDTFVNEQYDRFLIEINLRIGKMNDELNGTTQELVPLPENNLSLKTVVQDVVKQPSWPRSKQKDSAENFLKPRIKQPKNFAGIQEDYINSLFHEWVTQWEQTLKNEYGVDWEEKYQNKILKYSGFKQYFFDLKRDPKSRKIRSRSHF